MIGKYKNINIDVKCGASNDDLQALETKLENLSKSLEAKTKELHEENNDIRETFEQIEEGQDNIMMMLMTASNNAEEANKRSEKLETAIKEIENKIVNSNLKDFDGVFPIFYK